MGGSYSLKLQASYLWLSSVIIMALKLLVVADHDQRDVHVHDVAIAYIVQREIWRKWNIRSLIE